MSACPLIPGVLSITMPDGAGESADVKAALPKALSTLDSKTVLEKYRQK